jgi:glycosyltransferase involved in cell wall biosynthesis
MRVLLLSHMFPRGADDWGGIFVQEQAVALREARVDVRVMAGEPIWLMPRVLRHRLVYRHLITTPTANWHAVAGIPTLYFSYLVGYRPRCVGMDGISYRREIKRLADRVRADFPFDLVHAHTAFPDGGAGAWLARRFNVPLIITEHTGPFATLTERATVRRQTERAINSADTVIAVSNALKRDMLAQVRVREADRIQVLGNGVNPELFRPEGTGPPDDGTVCALWIGGFLPVKQPLMLIDAFAMALKEDSRLRLSLVGRGFLEEEVRARIKSAAVQGQVSVFPSAPRAMVADYMRRHHFLVISSESETFGLVAVEAMACGRPVLSTRCGGPEETIGQSGTGELVDNSVGGLAKGFLAMAARHGEFCATALHEYARSRFGLNTIAERLKAVYSDSLVNKRMNNN